MPLLVVFIWLAWSGWREYRKVEAYQAWAKQFEKAKYDLYAVLGQNGSKLTYGKPTLKGPTELKTFSLEQVQSIGLWVDDCLVNLEDLPNKGRSVILELKLSNSGLPLQIPFTEIPLAASWTKHLQQYLESLRCDKD